MTGNAVDPETGLPRILSQKCETCIFRPGNKMHLEEGRREEMADEALANDSWIVCHSTLPYGENPKPVGEQAVCRGFVDVHGAESTAVRLAWAFNGPGAYRAEVDPPE